MTGMMAQFLVPSDGYLQRLKDLAASIGDPSSEDFNEVLNAITSKTQTVEELARAVFSHPKGSRAIFLLLLFRADYFGTCFGRHMNQYLLTKSENFRMSRAIRKTGRLLLRCATVRTGGMFATIDVWSNDGFIAWQKACSAANRILDEMSLLCLDRVEAIAERAVSRAA